MKEKEKVNETEKKDKQVNQQNQVNL